MAQRFTVIQGGLTETMAHRPSPDRHCPPLALVWSRDAQAVSEGSDRIGSAAAEAVDRAIRARLAALGRPVRRHGAVEIPARALDRPRRPRAIPAEMLLGVRPEGWAPPSTAVPVFEDRVPVVAAPSAPAPVDIVGRMLARSHALRLAFRRRVGEAAGGALNLVAGPMAWRRARG